MFVSVYRVIVEYIPTGEVVEDHNVQGTPMYLVRKFKDQYNGWNYNISYDKVGSVLYDYV